MMMVVMVMMPVMAVAVADVSVVMSRVWIIVDGRRGDQDWRRRNDHSRRVNRHDWRADRRRGHDHRGDRQRKPDVNAERNTRARRGGGCGGEGDCDCTEQNYLFHSYQFDAVFTVIFTARNSSQVFVIGLLTLPWAADE